MKVTLKKDLLDAIGSGPLKTYGLDPDSLRWNKTFDINLASRTKTQIAMLRALVEPHAKKISNAAQIIRDCDKWIAALSGSSEKAGSVAKFEPLLRLFLSRVNRHYIYRHDEERDLWQAYYVNYTEYHPPVKYNGGGTAPPYVSVHLVWVEFGGRRETQITFHSDDCIGYTPEEALANKGYIPEVPDLRAEYDRRHRLFGDWHDKIGTQFLAVGIGTDDVDGNNSDSNQSYWYWRRTKSIVLDKNGEPSRVVVDVWKESDEKENDRERVVSIRTSFWAGKPSSEEEDDIEIDAENRVDEPEIPLHPMLVMFDMRRHKRLRVDVGQLEKYVYDSKLGAKLVLPDESRDIVDMLLAHRGGFQDIIRGKSGGAIIICAGVPGTGKTLTAEVYSEVMGRPLYSVQASQLGVSPNELETELLKVFARSARWGSILLLDEADVYVAKRGSDLIQNAIVGVFLRVLEYYKGVLFLTTNRSDLVDDAILSRCLARIDYAAPPIADQRRIWRILSDTSGVEISDDVIDETSIRFPTLTGRDVKNLVKLASLVSTSKGKPITADMIAMVKRFKPTMDTGVEAALPAAPSTDSADRGGPAKGAGRTRRGTPE